MEKEYNKKIKFDDKFDPDNYFTDEKSLTSSEMLKKDFRDLTLFVIITVVATLVFPMLFIAIGSILGYSMWDIGGAIINVSVFIFVVLMFWLMIGFSAGKGQLYAGAMVNAWTNTRLDDKTMVNDYRSFISMGKIAIMLLFVTGLNIFYFTFVYDY